MKKLRWQLIIIFLTGLVVGALLLSEQPPAIVSVAPEPVKGGIYTEAIIGSLQRLNPALDAFNPADRDINRLLFSSLLRYDSRGMPQNDLVESWGATIDGQIYNFTLRDNVFWHDGEPFTSDDVMFTIELMREENDVIPADIRAFWQEVDVKILSEDTLQFRLPAPFAPFLDYLSFGVLPQHILGGMTFDQIMNDSFNLQPVGTGPYAFERLIVEDEQIIGIMLQSFDQYYGTPAFIEQMIFRYYPDAESALAAYRAGQVQGISNVTADILPAVLAEPGLSVYTGRKPEMAMVLFNLKNPVKPFFDEKEVREALMIGLNRQWIVDRILQGQAFLANGPIFPGSWAYFDGLEPRSYDVELARDMLKKAGYVIPAEDSSVRVKEDTRLSFDLLHPDTDLHTRVAESIQRDWARIEVQVNLVPMPYDQLVNQRLVGRDFEAALVDLNLSRTPDPDPYPFWNQAQATGGQNYSQWDNRLASDYLEQARVTLDMEERARLYRNFQVVFNNELPALPLYFPVYTYAVDRQVQGVQMGPLYDSSDRLSTVARWFLVAALPSQPVIGDNGVESPQDGAEEAIEATVEE
jgi:peptide/nickel transport system substrate-binding protein